ncbi:MAG: hypothetical protein KatS3mg094_059 [Candidatus Parcubacteria bacterium]|nr:MAG: hypothetical protein KatS3mg094_059 [Candidatus Parcubacteria bacterium]
MPEIFKPEKFLKRNYWKFEDFREAVSRSSKRKIGKIPPNPKDQIPYYIQRIIDILKKESGKELFKKQILYKKFIIKPENIPSDYFKNVLLVNFAEILGHTREELREPQIRQAVIELFEKRIGQSFETYQVPEQEKQQLIQQIIEDQKRSLDTWFDYLTSPEAENYPTEFRYWIFAEVLRCGAYDEIRKEYNKRTETTVATFPELNSQALGLLIDELIRKEKGEPSGLTNLNEEQQKELQKLIQSEDFRKLYPWLLEYVNSLKLPEEKLIITEGKWKLFSQASNPKDLIKAIGGFNTNWCIAGEETAKNYLSHSDIYIYFSEDNEGNPTIPRVAIVFNRNLNQITEIRGISKGQNLDQYITPVVKKSLTEGLEIEEKKIILPGSERYLQATEDMNRLAEIYIKYLNNQELDLEELKFLYEIDRDIVGFGYEIDERINNILRRRNLKKDLSKIFNCREEQITTETIEITDETVVVYDYLVYLMPQKWTYFPKKLTFISGNADFSDSEVEDLGNLRIIRGDAFFERSRIKTLKNLEEIGGNTYFSNSEVEDLGNLRIIRGDTHFERSRIKTLKNLEEIRGNAFFKNSEVEDLGNLRIIEGDANFERSRIKTLKNLEEIRGNAFFKNSEVEDLGNLRIIGGHVFLERSRIKTLKNLEEIRGNAFFRNSKVEDLGNLRIIRGDAFFRYAPIKNLGKLEEIGGYFFVSSKDEELIRLLKERGFENKIVIRD